MVISPAKALNFAAPPARAPMTQPALQDDIAVLSAVTRTLTARKLKALMGISDALAELNRRRFQAFEADGEDGLQAAFAFNGDVYRGLAARDLEPAALKWAQDHLRILSGLYGLLRPLDAIQPYRLEMGSRLRTRRGANLYAFWGARIATALSEAVRGHRDPTLINLASGEYFGAVDRTALAIPVVSCHFRQQHEGRLRTLGFPAKRARGLMARFAIERRADAAADLQAFDTDGYAFRAEASTDTDWVFARPEPSA